ncbi:cation diffusion facilitator family transporter [Endobacter medicaginis]|uniref:Cation diffusion facilitator family transporter n=3 Tax=Endobacter medicaginis TaxID=1181271 RepID=A0A839UTI3_9PROT|nr:cation diffusion facilitator family transporter [Endobacter medicaginis]MBB3173107.1 cation diffusion facilitator family transporter [Endobacter medicaginis]MCX5474468.1 cation diffusion facilitator family transporter [Endobacter medicaginis]
MSEAARPLPTAWASLGVACVVLALKTAAWRATGSVALYSDALECIINVAAAALALFALWFAGQPADDNHPYGHHKAEYLSAVVEGTLVFATAAAIAWEAWAGWQHPHPPSRAGLGMAVNAAASAINLVWGLRLLRIGARARSPALAASGRHVLTDVWTSAGVLAGFALVVATGIFRLDAVIAALVAINILYAGYRIVRDSVGGLMDEIVDPALRDRVECAIATHLDGAIEAHDLRCRRAGAMTFVEFHLVVDGGMPVSTAHAICDRLESAVRRTVGLASIYIHVEPDEKAKEGAILPARAA